MSRRVAWALSLVIATAGGVAYAQGSPTAKPSGTAAPAKKPDPKASGQDKKSPAKGAPDGGAPESGGGKDGSLPSGHPPVEGDDDDDSAARGGGQKRTPHAGGGKENFFQPPEDTVVDDPALPLGTVVITVKDPNETPVPQAPLGLDILHNSVAKGESSKRVTRETDEGGSVRFDELENGAGVSYRATVANGPALFEAPPFNLGDKSGKRVTLHVYEVTRSVENLRAGMWGVVYLQLREDAISVEQHMTILNVDPVAWVPEKVVLGLPEDYKAFVKPEGMGGAVRWEEVKGEGATLTGTITPGQHESGFRYQVPLEGSEKQTITLRLPAKVFQIGVMAEASKSMGMSVAGFPAAQRADRSGRKVLMTKKQSAGPGDEMQTVEITLSGLPVPGPGRWVAAALAASTVIGGVWFFTRKRDERVLPDDTRQDLEEAKNALLDEIVSLERAHKKGDIGPKTYEKVRNALLDALARIVQRLEAGRPPRKSAQASR